MEERKGDPRIYIITCFFFSCVVSGGVLLGLYIFLPEEFWSEYYAIGGLVLVGVPWIFWFSAYIYKCFSPSTDQRRIQNGQLCNNNASAVTSLDKAVSPRAKPTSPTGGGELSPGCYTNSGHRVRFGEVIVLGDEEKDSRGNVNDVENGEAAASIERHWRMISDSLEDSDTNLLASTDQKASVDHREIEMPSPLL